MLTDHDIELLCQARHGDPFAVLGVHELAAGRYGLAAMLPGADQVAVLDASTGELIGELVKRHADGAFDGELSCTERPNYRLQVRWSSGYSAIIDDPYRFAPLLGELDVWLLGEGSHLRPYEVLGASMRVQDGVPGTGFAVWAPNAAQVSLVGDFNLWDARRHPMRVRRECGVWEIFLPGVGAGTRYKFQVRTREGKVLPQKADPYALQAELRPATASVVARMPSVAPPSTERQRANALDAPVSIYEVHLGSWRRKPEEGNRFLTWQELMDTLIPYAVEMGFTHLELLPVSEHPFDGSWGYQPIGLYAPTARFGDAAGFRRFVDRCHAAGLGLILDWVPAHFPSDAHGLAQFDGTHLYEYADPREGFHQDWNTLIYNFGRTEVSNFLVANALFWLERYNVDGLRVDAVASMLYRDYSRKAGEWLPNQHGGRENLEAIEFLKRMNLVVGVERPQGVTLAEESTAFPAVSRPTYAGGLGFHYKWNMGWMHDTLAYMRRDPIHRQHHHGEMTFSLAYAFNENFVLPLSHDEVVHGKGSMLGKMPGDRWQQFANLRAYYGYMFGHPGKKLLFMGCEFAQAAEWNHDQSLDWHLLADLAHEGVRSLVRDLNALLRRLPALHRHDFGPEGFEWIDHGDAQRSLLSFVRRGDEADALVLVVCNFTPTVHRGFRLGVPRAGNWRECLNTDSAHYGGSNTGTPLGAASTQPAASHGHEHSIAIDVPPLATVMFGMDTVSPPALPVLATRAALPPLTDGVPWPMGVHCTEGGINIAVFSAHAQAIDLCVFDAAGVQELQRLRLPGHTGDVWHGHLAGASPGLVYGLRAHGPWRPDKGLRFNPTKLLLDPYARDILGHFDWADEHFAADRVHARQMDARDNARSALKARVTHDAVDWEDDKPPGTALADTVVYEMHVKGFSMQNPRVPPALRGTYAGLAHAASIEHLRALGVTAVSLLPVHFAIDEERLRKLGLNNYWGYNTIGFFCPNPRYASGTHASVRDEFRGMVKALHRAGIEVLLDVVYNHTAEGDSSGPSISFAGLDNASYYRLQPNDRTVHENHTGCGNTVDVRHPRVLQLVLDSLRYWVEHMHVDGFRFDLATVLGRGDAGFDRHAAFFTAAAQDPVLQRVKLIAEPWDIGPGGYQVGGFPNGWPEWNDRFRDDMRGFWLGHASSRGAFAQRLCGSSDLYQARGRSPFESLNYVISHDGFTLRDLLTYERKHNEANGENNRDGTDNNLAFNCGAEEPTDDAVVSLARARLQRALLASTLLAQGVPMLCAGDEIGHTQGGNNNPYCQDNAITWIDWANADADLNAFTARVIALRRRALPFGARWYTGLTGPLGLHDLAWMNVAGEPLQGDAWNAGNSRALACLIGEPGRAKAPLLMLVNADAQDCDVSLPAGVWEVVLDSGHATGMGQWHGQGGVTLTLPARSLMVLAAAGAGIKL